MKRLIAILSAVLLMTQPVLAFQFNDGTLNWGECTHTYDNACDPKCNNCGLNRTVDPHPYVGAVTTPATCGANGVKTYTCSVCGDRYTEQIPATGVHVYDVVVTDPTCEAGGYTTYVCEDCGHTYATKIPATGHKYETTYVDARCDAEGYDLHTCTLCGDSYKDNFTPMRTEHGIVPGEEFFSCTEPGYAVYYCMYCDYSYRETWDAPGHSPVVFPTIWECNRYTYCWTCDEILIPATGHLYTNELERQEPTCTADGYVRMCCYGCAVYETTVLPATGHTYTDACDGECDACGAGRTPPHQYGDPYDADCDLCGATREVNPMTAGDVNGDGEINVRDYGLLQQYLNDWDVILSLEAADVNDDADVNVRDLGLLQQYLNDWDVTLK